MVVRAKTKTDQPSLDLGDERRSRLSTRETRGDAIAVYCGRAKIGYIAPACRRPDYIWELILVSEQMGGHPRGYATSREAALTAMEETLEHWMRAAGMEFSDGL